MSGSKRSSYLQPNNAGCLFWLAVIVVILVLFVLNWGKIQETLSNTNFLEIVKTQAGKDGNGAAPSATKTQPGPGAAPAASPTIVGDGSANPEDLKQAEPASAKPTGTTAAKPAETSASKPPAGSPAPSQAPASQAPASAAPAAKPAAASAPLKTRTANLFFVKIDEDGTIVRQEVKRQLPVSDSPLTDSIGALLAGPNEDELRRKLVSLVPEGTKLLSARVRGSTAFLNFNEAFVYNRYGIEGYAGQLKQIVYTSTSFPTVQDVQFLIEGEKRDYLGEGLYIGAPLGRNSF